MPNPIVTTYNPEQLSAGDFPVVTDAVTIGLNLFPPLPAAARLALCCSHEPSSIRL